MSLSRFGARRVTLQVAKLAENQNFQVNPDNWHPPIVLLVNPRLPKSCNQRPVMQIGTCQASHD
jgi:hypothetical protein